MLDNIRALIDVIAEGSFTAAAKRQGVAVSSITRKIEALEKDLGVKLVHRNARVVLLTDAGHQFYSVARDVTERLDSSKRLLHEAQTDPRGLLTVTAPAAFGRRHVTPALSSFLKKYPLIEVDFHVSDTIVELLSQRVDVAIRVGVLPDSDLIATRLAGFRRMACASPDYLARCGHPAVPEELVDHNCLSFASAAAPPDWWAFEGINRNQPLSVKGNFRSDDTETLLQAATEGVGIVHLASWLVGDMIESGKLIDLFPDVQTPAQLRSSIHAVWMPGRSHPTKSQLLITHLKREFELAPRWGE